MSAAESLTHSKRFAPMLPMRPAAARRHEILRTYAQQLSDGDLEKLAAATPGMSGRDLRDICEQAERRWASKARCWAHISHVRYCVPFKGLGEPNLFGMLGFGNPPRLCAFVGMEFLRRLSLCVEVPDIGLEYTEPTAKLPPPCACMSILGSYLIATGRSMGLFAH